MFQCIDSRSDEWKEFQKSIQDDVKDVENRLDEEEV